MTEERIKEDLSGCYLKAIAAINGIAFEFFHHDEDSIDGALHKVVILPERKVNVSIGVQLKATSSGSLYSITGNEISYKLKAKNYNDLCIDASSPNILALLVLPSDSSDWVHWSIDELMIRGKMFWACFQGNEKTKNTGTITVKVPTKHVLSVNTINDLMVMAAREGL